MGSKGDKLVIRRQADGRIDVRGWIGSKAGTRSYLVVIDDPAPWVAGTLRSALAAQGVTVTGQVRLGSATSNAVTVATLASPPLTRLASAMNRESINHFAELLFRDVAHVSNPEHIGSAEYGNTALRKFMADKVGATATDVTAADGSGLSTLDRVTARSLVQLLSYSHRASWSADFHASLPVAGESELLRHRIWPLYYPCLDREPASCPSPAIDRQVSAGDHVRTFRWLYADSLGPDGRAVLRYSLARLEDRAGERDSALAHYRALSAELEQINPRIAAQLRRSVARLSR
jgi:D-alanyl-D-alanine carboxypeptidase